MGSLTDNDFDPDGDNIIINTTPVTTPTDGILTINPDGTFTFTPDPDFVGEDSFEYQVCDDGIPQTCDTVLVTIEVLPNDGVNGIYATDDAATGTKNSPISGDVSTNDNDPEGDNMTFTTTPITSPANGSVVINTDGTFTYTPTTDFTGPDQFTYRVCDDGTPQACDTATVYLTITEGGFPPVILPVPITIPQDSMGSVCIPILDPNAGDSFTAMSCGANNGTETITVNGNEVCIEYLPNAGFSGTDSVCVIVCDQTGLCDTSYVPITVVEPLPPSTNPEPPVITPTTGTTPADSTLMVCSVILDPNNGDTFTANLCTGSPEDGTATVMVNGNELCLEYTPNAGFSGTDEVCIIVCDQTGLCDTVDIPITVIPEILPPDDPQPPVIVFPPIVVPEDSSTTVCGPIVDGNVEDTHTVTICEQPANGIATAAVDNTTGEVCITFDPDPGYEGIDSVCIIVCDQTGLCDTLNVPILITPRAIKLELKVMLQGAMLFTSDGLMRDDLKIQGLVPLNQPYSSILSPRFTHIGGGGTETTSNLILSQNLGTADAIVDWVFIEIRDAIDPSTVVKTIAALVQRDGDIVDAATGLTLCVLELPVSFHVSVKHRNHLGVMTANPLTPMNGSLMVDFTTMGDADVYHFGGYDGLEMTTISGKRALWAGNANADNKVKYDGSANDRIKLANDVLTSPSNSGFNLNFDNAIDYLQGDIDMSGKAKYDGSNNDRILIQNLVLTYPLNTLILNNYNDLLEQLP